MLMMFSLRFFIKALHVLKFKFFVMLIQSLFHGT
jgi:hypothetical protein